MGHDLIEVLVGNMTAFRIALDIESDRNLDTISVRVIPWRSAQKDVALIPLSLPSSGQLEFL